VRAAWHTYAVIFKMRRDSRSRHRMNNYSVAYTCAPVAIDSWPNRWYNIGRSWRIKDDYVCDHRCIHAILVRYKHATQAITPMLRLVQLALYSTHGTHVCNLISFGGWTHSQSKTNTRRLVWAHSCPSHSMQPEQSTSSPYPQRYFTSNSYAARAADASADRVFSIPRPYYGAHAYTVEPYGDRYVGV
jgi:hypothetical protein